MTQNDEKGDTMPNTTKDQQPTIQRFTTEDLHLAAFLNCCKGCEGLKFKGIENTDHCETKEFIFEGEDKEIDELLLTYYNRRGLVEPQRYNEETGRLRDLLKIEKSRKRINICEDC